MIATLVFQVCPLSVTVTRGRLPPPSRSTTSVGTWRPRIGSGGGPARRHDLDARKHVRVGDEFDLADQTVLEVEREGGPHSTGDHPGRTRVAVEGSGGRALGAVEAGRDRRRPLVHRQGAHPVSDGIHVHHRIRVQHREQVRDLPVVCGVEERRHDGAVLLARDPVRGWFWCALDLAAGSAGQLTHGRSRASQHHADLVEWVAEDVVQDECRSFGRGKGVEHDLHRRSHLLGDQHVGLGINQRRSGISHSSRLGLE
jgi:hypothetical protein